jgi:hypothetical protein
LNLLTTFADQGWGGSEEEVSKDSYVPCVPSVSICSLSILYPYGHLVVAAMVLNP